MLKKIFATFMSFMMICCSCAQKGQTDVVFDDVQSEYATSNGSLCKEGNVYYATANKRLFYYDEATKTSGLLCGRADCNHEDMSCDAYIDPSGAGIQIYQEKIYWIENLSFLCRMDLDGRNHEQVQLLTRPDNHPLMVGLNPRFSIYGDHLYVSVVKEKVTAGKAENEVSVYRYNMADLDAEAHEVFRKNYLGGQECNYHCRFYQDMIYIMVDYGGVGNDGQFEGELYQYDLKKESLAQLWAGGLHGHVFNVVVNEEGVHVLANKGIYEGETRRTSSRVYTYGVEEQNMQISEVVDIPQEEGFLGTGFENGYFMFLPGVLRGSPYRIYDWDGNLLREGKVSGNFLYCIGCDDTGWLFKQDDSNYPIWSYKVIRIPFDPEEEEEILIRYSVSMI